MLTKLRDCGLLLLLVECTVYNLASVTLIGFDSIKRLDCLNALGMESYAISDVQISASSEHNANHAAALGRLHLKPVGLGKGAWVAASSDTTPWLQIDLIKHYTKITSVATQGRQDGNHWVTKYSLLYSNDSITFLYYKEQGEIANKVGPY